MPEVLCVQQWVRASGRDMPSTVVGNWTDQLFGLIEPAKVCHLFPLSLLSMMHDVFRCGCHYSPVAICEPDLEARAQPSLLHLAQD